MYTLLMQEITTSKTKVVKQIMPTGQLSGLKATRANQPFFITLDSKQDQHNSLRDLELLWRNIQDHRLYLVPLNKAIVLCKQLNSCLPTSVDTLQNYLIDFTQPCSILEQFTASSITHFPMTNDQKNQKINSTSQPEPAVAQNTAQQTQPEPITSKVQTPPNLVVEQQGELHNQALSDEDMDFKKTLFTEQQIDWEMFKKIGLSRQDLVDLNLLGNLLRGYKSNCLVPIRLNFSSIICNMEARISLKHDTNKAVVLVIHAIKKEPLLHIPFFGHEFTKQDKANLLSTGNMGRVVNLQHKATAQEIPSIISIDKMTNHIIALAVDKIRLPEQVKAMSLSAEQKRRLYLGEAIYVKGLLSKKNVPFNAYIQYNADRRALQYFFEDPVRLAVIKEQNTRIPTSYKNIQLTLQQQEQLNYGETVYLEQITDKHGRVSSGYIVYDSLMGVLRFSEQDPYKEQ